ncbi:hypothetical protein L873DRAFT_1808817 [Choiromyces venosus 120613-1]|uniref:Uncharacterized protein n=1 Tax=Choiromyces venosus 120613-1 TaxID=1336337 RepID=A0A3N4JIX3_9PEZI|nr:hypothetical protein L873DRAFT_1808817 [Choiromyces venosus 120613-1]
MVIYYAVVLYYIVLLGYIDNNWKNPRGYGIEHSVDASKSFPILGHVRQNSSALLSCKLAGVSVLGAFHELRRDCYGSLSGRGSRNIVVESNRSREA